MKKSYSLDFSIERDTDRVAAVTNILNSLEKDPSPSELEQMASYILYGKDENGLNAVQRGEITNSNTRYKNYQKKDDKLLSLDAILENPLANQAEVKSPHSRDVYVKIRPSISRKTDGAVPGMRELWQSIDSLDRWIHVLEGKLPPNEDDLLFDNSYRLYRLKHNLIELRRHQYYLKDSYNPPIHFQAPDHPKAQFIHWDSDTFYWISLDEWRKRTAAALTHLISKDIKDYETKTAPDGTTQVKWVVRPHTFDWYNPQHVAALLNHYDLIYNQLYEKLDTYGRTLIFDFQRYRKMCHFSEVREFLIDMKIAQLPYSQIIQLLQQKYGISYNENHLSVIYKREIPEQFVLTARKHYYIIKTPKEECKICCGCKRRLPRNSLFFSRNRDRKDGYSSSCKECEKKHRIKRGEQTAYDRRSKETTLYKMQTRKT